MNHLFGQRLKFARKKKGYSQEELAVHLGITKQAVSKYEKGLMQPSSKILIQLSHFLGLSPDFFYKDSVIKLEGVAFRKKAKLRGKALDKIEFQIIDYLERYLELEQLLDISNSFENPIVNIVITEEWDIESAVIQLLESWELGFNPLPNIIEMLEDIGIKVLEVDGVNEFDGLSAFVNETIPVIVINKNFDIVRKRFTLLHELGHLLLNIPEEIPQKKVEKYCNRFAGAMLIPKTTFIKELGEIRNQISIGELIEIKEYYGVSVAAIVYRATDLGIISRSISNRFWKYRSKDERFMKETVWGEYKGKEESGRFMQLLYKAIAEEVISMSKAAFLINENVATIQRNLQMV